MKLETSISTNISCSKATLWDILTNPEISPLYMYNCRVESDWIKGRPITWSGNYQGYKAFQKGEILEIEPENFLKYTTFDPNYGMEDIPSNYIHVSYLISGPDNNLKFEIKNVTFDGKEERMGHINAGWEEVIKSIKAIAENK